MKKLIMLSLFCISSGMLAQESYNVFNAKNDNIKKPYVDTELAFLEESKIVYASVEEGLSNDQDAYYSKSFLDPHTGEISKDDRILIKKDLIDDSESLLLEGMATFSKDRKTVFFSVNRKLKNRKIINGGVIETKKAIQLQLFKAGVNKNGEWVNIEMLPFNSTRHSTGQPYLNKDDTKLYFVSDGPESLGRTDIFVVDLYKDGTYGTPVNLGPEINSREREIFPFINEANLLYFSSDVQNKKGDLDVFASKIFDNTVSKPVKLKGAIDIEKTDFTYDIYKNEEMNSFSSKEQPGKGVEEIYASIDASGLNIDCQQQISGIVRNGDTQELLTNVKIMLYDDKDQVLSSFLSDETDASFSFEQSCNASYTLKGYLDGYLIGELAIKTVNDLNAAPKEIVMKMSMDGGKEVDVLSSAPEAGDATEVVAGAVETVLSNEEAKSGANYNFSSYNEVYTVQIGAFKGNAETDKYIKLSSLFNHYYDDGLNRYFSGIFDSHMEAMNYLDLLKKNGFNDAFVVGLKGDKRF